MRKLIDEKPCEEQDDGDELNSNLEATRSKLASAHADAAE